MEIGAERISSDAHAAGFYFSNQAPLYGKSAATINVPNMLA